MSKLNTTTLTSKPTFDRYACVGDTTTWSHEGFDFTARIAQDHDSRTGDYDCYDEQQIQDWKDGNWFFCGVILSVSFKGIELDDHAASLWGIECNIGENNDYLSEVCEDLQSEALAIAKLEFDRIKALFAA